MNKTDLMSRLKKIEVEPSKDVVAKILAPESKAVESVVTDKVGELTKLIADSSVIKQSPNLKKENMHVSQLSNEVIKRGEAILNEKKDKASYNIVRSRMFEYLFMIGEELQYRAYNGDEEAIKILDGIKQIVPDTKLYS